MNETNPLDKTEKEMTVSYKNGRFESVPYIRIANKLLTKYGFNGNDKILVTYEKEKIIIIPKK